jgi:hypothetical protein
MSNSPFDPNNPFPWYQPPVTPKPERKPIVDWSALIQPKPTTPSLADLVIRPTVKPTLFSLADIQPKRPRIFVSYQHSSDQAYYDQFSEKFHDGYESIFDNSLERCIDSDKTDYVIQRIRDNFITNTSCTIVLVGPTAHERKYLDWEIKATLDKEHGLIGIHLPNLAPRLDGLFDVPLRFAENVRSGYALWIHWNAVIAEPHALPKMIQTACDRPKGLIVNRHEIKKQNG